MRRAIAPLILAAAASSGCSTLQTMFREGLHEGALTIILITSALALLGYVIARAIAERRRSTD